jgi:hypothetical protein
MIEPVLQFSGDQREEIWRDRYLSEVRSCYFADLAMRFRSQQKWLTLASVLLSSSVAALLLESEWLRTCADEVKLLFTITSAVLGAFSLVVKNPERLQVAIELQAEWSRIAHEYSWLWNDKMYQSDAKLTLKQIQERERSASTKGISLPFMRRKMQKWERHVKSQPPFSTKSL